MQRSSDTNLPSGDDKNLNEAIARSLDGADGLIKEPMDGDEVKG